jgi:hypothetical protein
MGAYLRALAPCLCLLIALPALARPVSAESGLPGKQEEVTHQLAAAAAAISQLDQQIAGLGRSIADTGQRIKGERGELRAIARTLYVQPDSGLMALLSASSPGDALTRLSDLTAAGDRAAATERALDHDLNGLQGEQAALRADRQRWEHLRQQLEAQFRLLQSMASAGAGQPAVTPPTVAPRASAGPAPPATSSPPAASPPAAPSPAASPPPAPPVQAGSGSTQQIILDAFAPLGAPAQAWALRVAGCESHYNPNAVNPSSGASGLFQFLPSTWAHLPPPYPSESVFDPAANARAAARYYQDTGQTGGPWSCR